MFIWKIVIEARDKHGDEVRDPTVHYGEAADVTIAAAKSLTLVKVVRQNAPTVDFRVSIIALVAKKEF